MPPESGSIQAPTLRRAVTRWQIVGLALNDVIGSGIYLLPAAATALLGSASLLAVCAAGAVVALVVLCFAEASTYFDRPGSAYLYTREAFGDLVGFEVGWMAWLTRVAAAASLSVGFAQAVSFLLPSVATGWPRALVIAGPLLGLAAINIVGIRSGVRTAMVLVVAKTIPLLLFIGVGALVFSGEVFSSQSATSSGGLGSAALLLLFAYAGFENTPALAGEYRNPRRDVPFALLTQITLVTLLYVGVQAVCLGVLPDLGAATTPLADAGELLMGRWGGWMLTVGAVVSILGTNSNTALAGPRYLFAVADDGFLPQVLGRIHPRYRTPATAIAVQTSIALPLALSGSFEGLAALSVVARLATYLGTAAAVPVLRRRMTAPPGSFRLPGGVAIPLVAAVLAIALGASASPGNLLAAAIALVIGGVLFAWSRRRA